MTISQCYCKNELFISVYCENTLECVWKVFFWGAHAGSMWRYISEKSKICVCDDLH